VRGPRRRLRLRAAAHPRRCRRQQGGGLLALRDGRSRRRVAARLGHGGKRLHLRRAAPRLRRGRPPLRPRPVAPLPDGAARPARGLRARGARVRAADPDQRDGVPPQGAHVRALLADRAAREDAAPARAALRPRNRLAPAPPLRLGRAPPRAARDVGRPGRARMGVRRRARGPARPARRRRAGRRDRPLLRPRLVGDGRRALELPAPRRPRDVGGRGGDTVNRALDVALAGVGLAVASPVLAASALAVKLQDRGPVLYRQTRVGKDGVDFELLKLRTMIVGAEQQGAGFAVNRGDARITRVGRLLRRLSLDALPQLWNVVRGDMSIIGPRPTLRYQVEQYDERQLHRLDVKPGITGWAQIHGRAALPWAERIELDLWYVRHRSWKTDLLILLRTPLALFGGTYKGATGGWHG